MSTDGSDFGTEKATQPSMVSPERSVPLSLGLGGRTDAGS
jgi:hypothetical protein